MGRVALAALALGGCAAEVPLYQAPPPVPSTTRWAAHPDQADPADEVPEAPSLAPAARSLLGNRQAAAAAVAFYVHPTTDLSMAVRRAGPSEAADLTSEAVRYQASLLNGVARVYAPHYQAVSLGAIRLGTEPERTALLAAAAEEVRAAFEDFLRQVGPKAPILLLGHGQGAAHLASLLRTHFDGQPLAARLVAAWLPGELLGADTFRQIPPCRAPDQTGCFASWASLLEGATLQFPCGSEQLSHCSGQPNTQRLPVVCFNPMVGGPAPGSAEAHRGAGPGGGWLGGHFFDFAPGLLSARCDDQGLLRIQPVGPRAETLAQDLAGLEEGDFHSQDVNLFYLDLRADAARRLAAWQRAHPAR